MLMSTAGSNGMHAVEHSNNKIPVLNWQYQFTWVDLYNSRKKVAVIAAKSGAHTLSAVTTTQ